MHLLIFTILSNLGVFNKLLSPHYENTNKIGKLCRLVNL